MASKKNALNTLYSFDIFDTLITRTVVKPSDIHKIVQLKLSSEKQFVDLPSYLINNFAIIRNEYENYCRKNYILTNKGFDIAIDDIYDEICINYNLSKKIINKIKNVEIDTEYSNILPIYKNIEKLKSLVVKGHKVILISDMYLSSETIRRFLTKFDNVFNDIEIYVSSEYKKCKQNGSLFREIKQKYKEYDNFVHFGDNKFSDIQQAKWNKIKPIQVEIPKLNSFEKFIIDNNKDIKVTLPLGVSKYLKSQENCSDTYKFSVSIAAPFLYHYVDWILKDAINRNFKHLYFVARDGYVLKIIADVIIEREKLDIQSHYFYSSRRVTRIPNRKNIDFFKDWLVKLPKVSCSVTPLLIEQLLGIPVVELKNLIKFNSCTTKLTQKVLKQLINNPKFEELLIKCNIEKQNILVSYLKQEIDFNNSDFAFVDINGTGKTQDILASIISEFYSEPIYYYYFHIALNSNKQDNSIKLSFIKTTKYYIGMILELFCRTKYGQTTGYKKNPQNVIEPILETINTEYFDKWKYDDYINGILDFTKLYQSIIQVNGINLDSIKYNLSVIDYLQNHMDKETANILGQVGFSEYGNEKNINECAPKNCFLPFKQYPLFKTIQYKRSDFPMNIILKLWYFLSKKTNYGYISKKKDLAYIRFFTKKINIRELIFRNNNR